MELKYTLHFQIPTKQKMRALTFSVIIFFSLTQKSTPLPLHFTTVRSRATNDLHVPPPKEFFQVSRPIPHPSTTPCTHTILSHDFGYTYGHEPVRATYAPPSHCPSTNFSAIILEWSASCRGRQFDRIFGVWLGGVELLRSCTAEPTRDGIFWKIQKDISRYNSLLMIRNQTLQVYLGNLIDKTYTGIYHVNLTIYYYPPAQTHDNNNNVIPLSQSDDASTKISQKWADKILPISRNLPLKDGLWFEIQNSTDVESKELTIPRNVYRAVLEVYVSYHESDEFWYTNLPNEYIIANNLSGKVEGNGAFRQVLVNLDGDLIGSISPFTVIYTGGINPLLWRPITAIGSFDLPTYDIEITPLLGKLLDGKGHRFGFSVANALNVWYVDANLHLWLDDKLSITRGHLTHHNVKPVKVLETSDFDGLDGKFFTGASWSISTTGWVESSLGNITTTSIQSFEFENYMVLGKRGNMQIVNQTIEYNTTVVSMNVNPLLTTEVYRKFPLFLYTDEVDLANSSYTYQSNVTLGFNEEKTVDSETKISLRNFQKGEGNMFVKNNLVVGGVGSTHQVYKYDENNGGLCYFRNVSSYNYTILYDQERKSCELSPPRDCISESDNRAMLQRLE